MITSYICRNTLKVIRRTAVSGNWRKSQKMESKKIIQLESKFDINEFRNNLIKLTKKGNPKIMGTPFAIFELLGGEFSKPFFGQITESKFKITLNKLFFPTPYVLEGEIHKTKTNFTIDYIIKPIWFGYLWIRIIPLLFITVFGLSIYNNKDLFTKMDMTSLLFILIVFSFIMFLPIFITYRQKLKLEKKLINEIKNNSH